MFPCVCRVRGPRGGGVFLNERNVLFQMIIVSLVLSLAANVVGGLAWSHANAQRDEGRELVAKSDFDLCTSLYRNQVATANDSLKQVSVKSYRHLLPFLTDAQAANIVAETKASLIRKKEKFDPKQCLSLPTQKLAH